MDEEPDDQVVRRALKVLAGWYAAAWLLPALLAGAIDALGDDDLEPGYGSYEGRRVSCEGDFGCPSEPLGVGETLGEIGLLLAPGLLVAIPLCWVMARRWNQPHFAGFAAAFLSWIATCLFHQG